MRLARATHKERTKMDIYSRNLYDAFRTYWYLRRLRIALKFLQNSYDETQRRKRRGCLPTKNERLYFFARAIGIALYAIMSYSAPNQIWEACVRTDLRFWRVKDTKDSLDNLRQCAHATSLHPLIQSFDVSELTDYIVKISALRTIRTVSVPSCLVAPEAGPRDQTLCEIVFITKL